MKTGAPPRHLSVGETVFGNFLTHCWPVETVSTLALWDLLALEGGLEHISLDRLEVAWALHCYPTQVGQLSHRSPAFANLQALRKEVNQAIEHAPDRPTPELPDALGNLADLAERSESCLVRIGLRTIELLCLQEIVKACTRRLWNGQDSKRTAVHRALIVAGSCGPEVLYQEMKANLQLDVPDWPEQAPLHRLNLCLFNMGVEPLPPEASLYMRAKAFEYIGKACLVQHGLAPVLVTAPHNIVLIRDGKPPHKMEESTTLIAERMALKLEGSSLTWSRRQQYRTELRWAIAKRRGVCNLPGNDSGLLDPTNRDPNFLSTAEVSENEWYLKMRRVADRSKIREFGDGTRIMLHLDVHGCRDPPHHSAHLNIGLGAMRQRCKTAEDLAALHAFGEALTKALGDVIDELGLKPRAAPVRVIVPENPEHPPHLCGAWAPSSGRHTQTQQAITFASFSHALQLEMSLALRKTLAKDKAAIDRLAGQIWEVWDHHAKWRR